MSDPQQTPERLTAVCSIVAAAVLVGGLAAATPRPHRAEGPRVHAWRAAGVDGVVFPGRDPISDAWFLDAGAQTVVFCRKVGDYPVRCDPPASLRSGPKP